MTTCEPPAIPRPRCWSSSTAPTKHPPTSDSGTAKRWSGLRDASPSSLELRDDCRDVVPLLLKTELPDTVHDCVQQGLAWQVPIFLQRLHQAALAKFFSVLVTGFGDAIGVKRKHVPGEKLLL